ncbi:hypothetical protein POTOM_030732 [Populus tomentosa]|uniref:Uncharacterized protein n=1 Tax=Populus tomentosa TaxID=118781 RepID=A0A8X7Z2U4_POPTO|nr:hypothetical protein POTOM_030732 [Populus tomentosa]
MVENDFKHVIRRGSSSAFLNRACQWDNCEFPKRRFCREGHDSIWAMKEYGDAKSWIKVFFIHHLKGRVSDFVGSKKNASSTSTDNSSGNEETKEHSSHVAGLDKNKKEKKKKGMKIMGGPEIVVGENRVLEGGASSSSATSRDIVTNERNGSSKEQCFKTRPDGSTRDPTDPGMKPGRVEAKTRLGNGPARTRSTRPDPELKKKKNRRRTKQLIIDLSKKGLNLYYNCPSWNYFEYQAFAIGSRSQAAKTYLERRFENFSDASRDDLIKDALIAVRETLQGETLKSFVCTVAVLGVDEAFHILDQETVQKLIDAFEIVGETEAAAAKPDVAAELDAAGEGGDTGDEGAGAGANEGAAPMET